MVINVICYISNKNHNKGEYHTCNSNTYKYTTTFLIALSHCEALLSLTWQRIHCDLWIFSTINHSNVIVYLLPVDPHL